MRNAKQKESTSMVRTLEGKVVELQDRCAELKAKLDAMAERELSATAQIKERDEALKRLHAQLEGREKDVAAAREEAALHRENLARAMGYIDRIHDQARPATVPVAAAPAYQEVPNSPTGPILREPVRQDAGYRQW